MKKAAVALVLLVVVLGIVFVVAARNLNHYLEANRPWIEEQVETALGRSVEIGGLAASIGWGVSAKVSDLAVADDPAYADESFVRAGEAVARVRLLPLLSGRVEVGRVEIRRPEIRVIQSDAGMNIDSLGGAPAPDAPAAAEPVAEDASGAGAAAVAVALVRIVDGTLLYRDTRVTPTSEVELGGLDVDFTSDGTLEAFRGRLEIDARTLRLRSGDGEDDQWEPLRIRADLRRDGDVLEVRGAELGANALRVDAEATLRGLAGGALALDTTFSSPGGAVAGVPFEGLEGSLTYGDDRATVESLVLRIFGGEISVAGVYNLRVPGHPAFSINTAVEGLRVEQAVASQAPELADRFEGAIRSDLKLTGTGVDWEALRPKLRGGGELHLEGGVLREINLGEEALGGLAGVPGLRDLVDAELRARYPALFGAEDTRFERADLVLQIADGAARIQELVLEARDFVIEGTGRIGLDGALDLRSQLICSEALSTDLVARQSALASLRSREGRVSFPVLVRGGLAEPRVTPDIAAIANRLGGERARDLLGRALEEAQRGGEEAGEGAPGARDSADELLRQGLDSLLGR